jgi:hypothetical protein
MANSQCRAELHLRPSLRWNHHPCRPERPVLVVPVSASLSTTSSGGGLEENLFRREEVQRRVVVSYPEGDTLTTRLKCGDIVLPLRLKPGP